MVLWKVKVPMEVVGEPHRKLVGNNAEDQRIEIVDSKPVECDTDKFGDLDYWVYFETAEVAEDVAGYAVDYAVDYCAVVVDADYLVDFVNFEAVRRVGCSVHFESCDHSADIIHHYRLAEIVSCQVCLTYDVVCAVEVEGVWVPHLLDQTFR